MSVVLEVASLVRYRPGEVLSSPLCGMDIEITKECPSCTAPVKCCNALMEKRQWSKGDGGRVGKPLRFDPNESYFSPVCWMEVLIKKECAKGCTGPLMCCGVAMEKQSAIHLLGLRYSLVPQLYRLSHTRPRFCP
ncbi:MAG: hypothetical protein ACE5KO_02645 [Candidatus Bathyarchaeia archaeon]